MQDMGNGEVQEVEMVEDFENVEDEQDQDIQNDQPDADKAIPDWYIPVYFNPSAKTVATPETFLHKIKSIYKEAGYSMHEDVLESLQGESKGQLRVYIRQIYKFIPTTMHEAPERQKAIFEAEKIYVRKKDEVLQILLEKKAQLGQFYEAQEVENYRRNSMDYLLSMVGLVDIDLQEMTSDVKEKNCRVTGIKDGTEAANDKIIEDEKEAGPSTYPTGCPTNYFDCLNKTNVES